jgi:hypothetical protein
MGFEIPDLPDKSSAAFIQALRQLDADWRTRLPNDAQLVFYVPLLNGKLVELGHITEEGYNSVRIQGHDQDGEIYVLIAHQATLQFFCKVRKVTPEHPRREIGFGKPHPKPPNP